MNIYLDVFDCIGSCSVFKSSGAPMSFYYIFSFILLKFYTIVGFYSYFYICISRILLYSCIKDHLLDISSIFQYLYAFYIEKTSALNLLYVA